MDERAFLARVRGGLEGTSPSALPSYDRDKLGGPDEDLASRFARELEAVGGRVYRASDANGARQAIADIVAEKSLRRIVRGDTPLVSSLGLDELLAARDVEVTVAALSVVERGALREKEFDAEVGITDADFGVAETGTLLLAAREGQGRAVSLLPPVHIAVVESQNIVRDLSTLFERLRGDGKAPASAYTLITGPSRTADIELVLTVGVHGPGELYVVLIG